MKDKFAGSVRTKLLGTTIILFVIIFVFLSFKRTVFYRPFFFFHFVSFSNEIFISFFLSFRWCFFNSFFLRFLIPRKNNPTPGFSTRFLVSSFFVRSLVERRLLFCPVAGSQNVPKKIAPLYEFWTAKGGPKSHILLGKKNTFRYF